MVEDFAAVGSALEATSADPMTANRIPVLQPVNYIQIVDVLLDDMIAAKPVEHIPVADLIFHFRRGSAHAFFQICTARLGSDRAAIPIDARRMDVADGPILQAGDGFQIVGLVAALKAYAHFEILGLRLFRSGNDPANTGTVHRHRLLHEDMLTLAHRFLEMDGTHSRRGGENDHVRLRNGLLVGVKADEDHVVLHLHGLLVLSLQILQRTPGLILECIGNRDQLHAFTTCIEGLICRAGTPTTGANQRDANRVAGRSAEGEALNGQSAQQGTAGHGSGGVLQETPARKIRMREGWLGIVHLLVS